MNGAEALSPEEELRLFLPPPGQEVRRDGWGLWKGEGGCRVGARAGMFRPCDT